MSRRSDGTRCLTIKTAVSQITYCHAVQCRAVVNIKLCFRPVNTSCWNYATEFVCGGTTAPLANGGKSLQRISLVEVQVLRSVKDQLVADEAARVIARRVIIVRPQ